MVQIIEPQIFGRGGLGNGMELSYLCDSTNLAKFGYKSNMNFKRKIRSLCILDCLMESIMTNWQFQIFFCKVW
jgi:hypothetical protein